MQHDSDSWHSTPVRVRYCECDPMNVAHHSSFVAWFELARTELLRNRGTSYADLEQADVLLMVTKMDIRYRRPVAYDDVVEIRVIVDHVGKARLRHRYEVVVVESGGEAVADAQLAADATIELACCGRDGRPRPLPDEIRSSAGA